MVNKGTNQSRKKIDIKKEFDRNHGKSFETLKEEFNTGKGTNAGKGTNGASPNPINPATNEVVTEHIIVSSGKAPKTSTPNSIYEVSRADSSRRVTYYDKWYWFSREDFGQQKTHGKLGYDRKGKVPPHEHKQTYKSYNGNIYIKIKVIIDKLIKTACM